MEVANLGSRLSFLNELYLELDLIFADGMLAHNAPETRAGSTPGTVGCQQWQKPAGDLLADLVADRTLYLWHDARHEHSKRPLPRILPQAGRRDIDRPHADETGRAAVRLLGAGNW